MRRKNVRTTNTNTLCALIIILQLRIACIQKDAYTFLRELKENYQILYNVSKFICCFFFCFCLIEGEDVVIIPNVIKIIISHQYYCGGETAESAQTNAHYNGHRLHFGQSQPNNRRFIACGQ